MLVLAGTLNFDPSGRDAVINAVTTIMAATREEAGCLDYRFSLDIADDMLHVFEHWESDEVWQDHMTTPHVAAFGQAIGGLMKGASIRRFDVTSHGPLFPDNA